MGLTAGGCRRRVHLTFPGRMNVGDQAKVGEPVGGPTLPLADLGGRQNHLPYGAYHDGDLSRWMQWLLTSHVRRYHRHYQSSGHVWQGRFKAFPVQDDEHYWTVLRYIERNPLRAGLVQRSQDWEWSSLKPTARSGPEGLLPEGPLAKFRGWTNYVNGVETEAELAALRKSIARGTPYGEGDWQHKTARKLGLESSLRPRGRPRRTEK